MLPTSFGCSARCVHALQKRVANTRIDSPSFVRLALGSDRLGILLASTARVCRARGRLGGREEPPRSSTRELRFLASVLLQLHCQHCITLCSRHSPLCAHPAVPASESKVVRTTPTEVCLNVPLALYKRLIRSSVLLIHSTPSCRGRPDHVDLEQRRYTRRFRISSPLLIFLL